MSTERAITIGLDGAGNPVFLDPGSTAPIEFTAASERGPWRIEGRRLFLDAMPDDARGLSPLGVVLAARAGCFGLRVVVDRLPKPKVRA
jgi:hypothetical protein